MPRPIDYYNLTRIVENNIPLVLVAPNTALREAGVLVLVDGIRHPERGGDALFVGIRLDGDGTRRFEESYANRFQEAAPPATPISITNLSREQHAEINELRKCNLDYHPFALFDSNGSFTMNSDPGYPGSYGRFGFNALDARIASHYKAIISLLTPFKYRSINEILPGDVVDLVTHSPSMPQLPGIIRNITNAVIPPEVIRSGTNAIKEWLLQNVTHPTSIRCSLPLANVTAEQNFAEQNVAEQNVFIRFTFSRRESGTCYYTAVRSYEGEYEVPLGVVRQGVETIHRYIGEMADDDGDYELGDHEYQDYDATDTGDLQIIYSSASEAVAALRAAEPNTNQI